MLIEQSTAYSQHGAAPCLGAKHGAKADTATTAQLTETVLAASLRSLQWAAVAETMSPSTRPYWSLKAASCLFCFCWEPACFPLASRPVSNEQPL